MPQAEYVGGDYMDIPEKAMEIIGVGVDQRKSKTFLTDAQMAFILSSIRARRRAVIDALRQAHANWYERPVYQENDDGDDVVVGWEDDWLTDEAVIEKYRSAKAWNDIHQEFVEHMGSHKGFTINAVTGHELDNGKKRREPESSSRTEEPRQKRW